MIRTKTRPNMTRRAALAGGLAGLILPGTAWPQDTDRELEGGLGGTGIVGILTDFGSLIVAGNYVKTDASTVVTDGFGRLREADLALGDSLTVEAAAQNGILMAQRVHLTHPLVGQITRIERGGRRITVNGTVVTVPQGLGRFGVGSRVAVSGLWNGDMVEASRIAATRGSQDLVSGTVNRHGTGPTIGGAPISGRGRNTLKDASFATAVGSFDLTTGELQSSQITIGRFVGAAGPLERLSIEGYLEPSRQAPGFRIAGLGHSFERNLSLAEFQNQRVLFNGAYAGRFDAQRAIVLPDTAVGRRRVLRNLSR